MKIRINQKASRAFGLAVLVSLASIAAFAAGNPNPGVLPINSSPGGKSYGKWTVAWWQWAVSAPAGVNPWFDDTTGQYAATGQNGPVWFMASTLGDSRDRTNTIPAGKMLFLPVFPWIFGATVGDCSPSNPGTACDVPTLREAAANAATSATTLEVKIDGTPLQELSKYRAQSPDSFTVTLPAGNVVGLPAGTYGPHVSDGYWLMLTPLSPGYHTIVVHVISSFGEFTLTYRITITGS